VAARSEKGCGTGFCKGYMLQRGTIGITIGIRHGVLGDIFVAETSYVLVISEKSIDFLHASQWIIS
jgi:hypothetical protein